MALDAPRPYFQGLINRRSFLTQAGILVAAGGAAWWLRENVVWPPPKAAFAGGASWSGWLAFAADEPRIVIVDVVVNGTPARALLDSGAQSCVVDRGLARRLALPVSAIAPVLAFGVSGAPQIARSAALDLEAGALRISGLRAAMLDLAPIAAASGRPFDLIIGQDVLRAVIADVDFPGGRLAFHDPDRHVPPPGAVATPARSQGRELLVPITVESRPLEVVLDTGASGALALSPASAEAVGLLDGRPVRTAPSITFGGLSQDRVVRARTLGFAGAEHTDVRVHIYSPAEGARIPAGLLGVEVLEGFRTIIDLGRGRLHLIAGPPRPRPGSDPVSRRRNRR
jgi:predicted aspartyl protease